MGGTGSTELGVMPCEALMDATKQLIIENIKKAWEHVPYPGNENIFTPDSYDDEDITEYFFGTTWEGHSVVQLRVHCSAISTFFSPKAYHYWLPAYLIASIEDPDELSQGVDRLIGSFTPEIDASRFSMDQRERFALLTNEQKLCIILVIEFILSQDEDPTNPEWTADEKIALKYRCGK